MTGKPFDQKDWTLDGDGPAFEASPVLDAFLKRVDPEVLKAIGVIAIALYTQRHKSKKSKGGGVKRRRPVKRRTEKRVCRDHSPRGARCLLPLGHRGAHRSPSGPFWITKEDTDSVHSPKKPRKKFTQCRSKHAGWSDRCIRPSGHRGSHKSARWSWAAKRKAKSK